jgi:hypothetical protein
MGERTAPEEFVVVVPMRTSQTFLVRAASPAGAKRKVQNWFKGERDEGSDLTVLDDVGQTNHRLGTRCWTVQPGA